MTGWPPASDVLAVLGGLLLLGGAGCLLWAALAKWGYRGFEPESHGDMGGYPTTTKWADREFARLPKWHRELLEAEDPKPRGRKPGKPPPNFRGPGMPGRR